MSDEQKFTTDDFVEAFIGPVAVAFRNDCIKDVAKIYDCSFEEAQIIWESMPAMTLHPCG